VQYDLAAYDRHGQLVLTVEVKAISGTDAEWASSFQEFLFDEAGYPRPPFFLLATPDRFYLWDCRPWPEQTPKTWEFDAGPLLAPYFQRTGLSPDRIHGEAFELMVGTWLADLMRHWQASSGNGEQSLRESGLIETLRGGTLAYESARCRRTSRGAGESIEI
jgi:hypothetical protein